MFSDLIPSDPEAGVNEQGPDEGSEEGTLQVEDETFLPHPYDEDDLHDLGGNYNLKIVAVNGVVSDAIFDVPFLQKSHGCSLHLPIPQLEY